MAHTISTTIKDGFFIHDNMADVLANFHGHNIRPVYFRIMTDSGSVYQYKVVVLSEKRSEETWRNDIEYLCEFRVSDDAVRRIKLIYHIDEHVWTYELV